MPPGRKRSKPTAFSSLFPPRWRNPLSRKQKTRRHAGSWNSKLPIDWCPHGGSNPGAPTTRFALLRVFLNCYEWVRTRNPLHRSAVKWSQKLIRWQIRDKSYLAIFQTFRQRSSRLLRDADGRWQTSKTPNLLEFQSLTTGRAWSALNIP